MTSHVSASSPRCSATFFMMPAVARLCTICDGDATYRWSRASASSLSMREGLSIVSHKHAGYCVQAGGPRIEIYLPVSHPYT